MKKAHKIILATALITVMLFISIPSVALAQGGKAPDQRDTMTTRVAEILGITKQKLDDAFKQAQGELGGKTLEARLQELVSTGTITQPQADQLKAWIKARPDIPAVGPRGIKKLLDEGKITQEQVNKYKEWLKARPDIMGLQNKPPEERAEQVRENRDALITRVAEILGITKQKLEDAFKQAQIELREKALDTRLQELVNKGVITQVQADQFKAWLKARQNIPRIWPAKPGK